MKTKDIFLSDESIAIGFIKSYEYPHLILPNIKNIVLELGECLNDEYEKVGNDIWIHKTAKINKNAEIVGPAIIDAFAEVRQCAFIRGNVIIGKNSVLGNSCEIKNAILFNEVQVPHFSYVGDSVLGYKSHMGAGSIISNLKSDKKNIIIRNGDETLETNMRKIGAFLGDYVEIGCGSVLNPGTIILPRTNVYPLTSVRGVIGADKIVKDMKTIVEKGDF